MKKALRSLVFESLALGQAFPTTRTSVQEVAGLIHRLQPMEVVTPLVRLGPPGDGGYLVPDDLSGIQACFSPGVAGVSGFEKACADRGMQVYMADRSVDGPAEAHPHFHFVKKYVGVTSDEGFTTIDDWVAEAAPDLASDLLLQIDIEGYEYETLLSMSPALQRRFRVIVGEFHQLNQWWNQPYFSIASRAFDKLLQTHTCVHIHPNNEFPPFEHGGLAIPPLAEITFLRKDRVVQPRPATRFPHPLDSDNTAKAHYALPACWYQPPGGRQP